MDLDHLKKRAKDLLAELTEPRADQDDRASHRADDDRAADDPAAGTDRLGRLADRPTGDRADRLAADRAGEPASDLPAVPRHRDDPAGERWNEPTAKGETTAGRPSADRRWEDPVAGTAPASEWHDDPEPRATTTTPASDDLPTDPERMVTPERADSFTVRWDEVKGEFVDAPRQAVAKADALVGELLGELGMLFAQQRRSIEQDFDRDEVSTEELRVALRRYRSFFDRLLSV